MKNIIFCLPGSSFSGNALKCWTRLYDHCRQRGYNITLSQKHSCNVYFVRNMCLGADNRRGEDQKPFNGEIDYDYLMWIDSDVLYTPDQFEKLLAHDKDIVSGLYLMQGGSQFATVEHWDEAEFERLGSFRFLTKPDLVNRNQLFNVSYTGFGFILVKKGVFESMKYPWFHAEKQNFKDKYVDCTGEDATFCLNANRLGYKIWIDPSVIVGHEKMTIY